jgi:hypothetical protein
LKQVTRPQKPKRRAVASSTVSPDIANHFNAVGVADVANRAACEYHWQLRRRLRAKL